MIHEPQDAYAEAVRRLRTNLEFANVDRDARVIMITSAVEREGKSTTIANLAVALARSGRNVALVDLDLRQPVLAKYFELQGRQGITDVVLERADLEATLATIRLPVPSSASLGANGSVGGVGRSTSFPQARSRRTRASSSARRRSGRCLQQLRETHDYVLVDAAPLLSVGDSMTLSARVDGVLLVTRLGVVNRPMLTDLRRELDASPANMLGFVVTGVDERSGYGYGYGQLYGSRHAGERRPAVGAPRTGDPSRRATRRSARKTAAGS